MKTFVSMFVLALVLVFSESTITEDGCIHIPR
jgi:hypothetical protein